MNSMSDCLRMANDIATNLSNGTFAEQATEARLREEARLRAVQEEQERVEAEQRAKKKAEEEELQRKNAYEEECHRIMQQTGYVDLGLPSGTKWNSQNQSGRYTFDNALSAFGSSLPDYSQATELLRNCKWERYDKGYIVIGKNGNKIYFSDFYDESLTSRSSFWTRTPDGRYNAFYYYITTDGEWGVGSIKFTHLFNEKFHGRDQQLPIRLVQ